MTQKPILKSGRQLARNPRHQQGFTLLELFITIGIVGIASMLALASMSFLLDESGSDDYARELAKTVNFSRVQAVSIGQTVTMCTIVSGVCANDWTKDITIFVDAGNNRTLGANQVLKIIEAVPTADGLSYTGTSLGISFYSDGSIGEGDDGVFTYKVKKACDLMSRGVDVNAAGRARFIESVTCT